MQLIPHMEGCSHHAVLFFVLWRTICVASASFCLGCVKFPHYIENYVRAGPLKIADKLHAQVEYNIYYCMFLACKINALTLKLKRNTAW